MAEQTLRLPATVAIGDTHVTLKRWGQSAVIVAAILGREETDGQSVIWLDRVIHIGCRETFSDDWEAEGAVVTRLVRGVAATGVAPAS
ncbi:hypothetical protein [Rhodanobacter sp. FW106-PBR-LB-2-11]|uniref:hypothetical protein n=1 Tax=Rhodanobacter sp. FW106-PBR-LB-2-11 TaxID=1524463 RepID=UPI0034E4F203